MLCEISELKLCLIFQRILNDLQTKPVSGLNILMKSLCLQDVLFGNETQNYWPCWADGVCLSNTLIFINAVCAGKVQTWI